MSGVSNFTDFGSCAGFAAREERRSAAEVADAQMEKAMSVFAGLRRRESTGFFAVIGEWLAELGMLAARSRSARQTIDALARLDDRVLKDIGLFRSDLDAAESLPLGADPVALLRSRRQARCNARFADRYY